MRLARRRLCLIYLLMAGLLAWTTAGDVRGQGFTITLNAQGGTAAQWVVPRYHAATSYPSGQLIGRGPLTVFRASAETQDQTIKAIICTEGINDAAPGIAEWQAGSTGYSAAVLQPVLRDFTLSGYTTDDWAGAGDVNDQPWVYNIGDPELYKGLYLYGVGGTVENIAIVGIPGCAIDVGRPSSARNGSIRVFDRLKWNLANLSARRVFAGIYNHAVDSHLTNCEVEAYRDYGFKLFSSVHFQNLHAYGGGYAAAAGEGPGLWFESNENHGGPVYMENGTVGIYFQGQRNSVSGGQSHTCSIRNVTMAGQANVLRDFFCCCAPVNILVSGDQQHIADCRLVMDDGGKGLHITEGNAQHITNVDITGYRPEGHGHALRTFGTNSRGIDVDDTLDRNVITATISYCTYGIDFSGGAIANNGNRIWINTDNVTTPVIWPASGNWTTTVNAAETCDVRINGVRYYRP